jgi:hypothetical protein
MASGWPLPRSEGLQKILEDGETRILFLPLDASALAGAILRFANDPDFRMPVGAAAGSAPNLALVTNRRENGLQTETDAIVQRTILYRSS